MELLIQENIAGEEVVDNPAYIEALPQENGSIILLNPLLVVD